jgi:hypothetical protein
LAGAGILRALIGERIQLPPALLERFPELHGARFRRGGLPVRVGGWCLGMRSVAGITLWRTVWLAPHAMLAPRLLLHELRHVHQFGAQPLLFPLLYVWESLRRGYHANRFETEAEAFAQGRLRAATPDPPPNLP